MGTYRRTRRVSWTSKTTNREILGRIHTRPHSVDIVKIQKTVGHLIRHDEYSQLQVMIEKKVGVKKGIGMNEQR